MCGRTGLFIKSNNQKISFQVEHTFKNYGPGVKYVHFVHRGKDLKWWGAQYGVKMAAPCVKLTFLIKS